MNFDKIVPNDFKADPCVFNSGRHFYDCYKDFVCPECGIFDWYAATKNGINAVPKLPAKMPDIFVTYDRLYVVSNKTKVTMTEINGCEADFYPIPNYDEYYVMLPKRIIFPPQTLPFCDPRVWILDDPNPEVRNSPFCIDKYPCKKCGQFYEIYPNNKMYIVPEDVTFAGIFLGKNGLDLVASRTVSEQLQKAKLKGMRIRKDAFANANAKNK